MFKTTLSGPSGNQLIAIQMEPTKLRAEGGPDYPRLIFPLHLTFTPVYGPAKGQERYFFLLGGSHSLSVPGHPGKIADEVTDIVPLRVGYAGQYTGHDAEFPLDARRIRSIEAHRGGDIAFSLSVRYNIGFYDAFPSSNQKVQELRNVIIDMYSASGQFNVGIPQSHWVKNILPGLGEGEYFLVEIPRGERVVKEAWKRLDEAEKSFRDWNAVGAYASCREIGKILGATIEAKFGKDHFITVEKWGRAIKKFNDLSSLALHLEEIKNRGKYPPENVTITKNDVEHLLIVTKCLLKYAQDLLAEKGVKDL